MSALEFFMHRFVLASALALSLPAAAFASSGDETMHGVEQAMSGTGEKVVVRMDITDSAGATEQRTLTMWTKAPEGGDSKTLIRFEAPAAIAGTTLLTVRRPGKPQDNWLYVPALDQVRRIAPQNRKESFVGSDFTIEDLSVVVDTTNRTYTAKGEEACGERTCLVVEDMPANDKAARSSGYGRVELRVDKETKLVARVDFYDKDGALLKVLRSEGMVQVGERHRWSSATIANVQKGTRTVMTVTDRPDETVDDSLFSPSALE